MHIDVILSALSIEHKHVFQDILILHIW